MAEILQAVIPREHAPWFFLGALCVVVLATFVAVWWTFFYVRYLAARVECSEWDWNDFKRMQEQAFQKGSPIDFPPRPRPKPFLFGKWRQPD